MRRACFERFFYESRQILNRGARDRSAREDVLIIVHGGAMCCGVSLQPKSIAAAAMGAKILNLIFSVYYETTYVGILWIPWGKTPLKGQVNGRE